MSSHSEKNIDKLFKEGLSDFRQKPSEAGVNRILDSIIDHTAKVSVWQRTVGFLSSSMGLAASVAIIATISVSVFLFMNDTELTSTSQIASQELYDLSKQSSNIADNVPPSNNITSTEAQKETKNAPLQGRALQQGNHLSNKINNSKPALLTNQSAKLPQTTASSAYKGNANEKSKPERNASIDAYGNGTSQRASLSLEYTLVPIISNVTMITQSKQIELEGTNILEKSALKKVQKQPCTYTAGIRYINEASIANMSETSARGEINLKVHYKKFMFETGIGYGSFTNRGSENIQYSALSEKRRYKVDSAYGSQYFGHWETIQSKTEEDVVNEIQQKNSTICIPFSIGYTIPFRKFAFTPKVGGILHKIIEGDVTRNANVVPEYAIINKTATNLAELNETSVGLASGIEIAYRVADRSYIVAEPYFSVQSPMTKADWTDLSEKVVGLKLGLNYIL